MAVKIYDKAKWQSENGLDSTVIMRHFQNVFEWLQSKDMLSSDGREILAFGIDSEISLNSKMVNERGAKFLDEYYDSILNTGEYGKDEFTRLLDEAYDSRTA